MELKSELQEKRGKGPKVSLVIPMYFCEEYVNEILDCMCNQSFSDVEILCIDDGSPDQTLTRLNEYAKNDSRIRVFRQDHRGAGVARNLGIDKSLGEYLIFLDVDDLYKSNYIEKMVTAIDENNADIAICQYRRTDHMVNASNYYCGYNYLFHPKGKPISAESLKDPLYEVSNIPHNKIFRRSFITDNNLRFSETMSTNDMFFSATALLSAKTVVFIEDHLFTYMKHRNPKSISTSRGKNPTDFVKAYHDLYVWLEENNLSKKNLRGFCSSFSGGLHNYSRYCEGDAFTASVVSELTSNEPWISMDSRDLQQAILLFSYKTIRSGIKQEQRLQHSEYMVPNELAAVKNQYAQDRREINNIESIKDALNECGRKLAIRDNIFQYTFAKVKQVGVRGALERLYRKVLTKARTPYKKDASLEENL